MAGIRTLELGGIGDTVMNSTTVLAPGATQVLVTLTLPVGAIYSIKGFINLSGTAETALSNLRFRTNATVVAGGGRLPSITGFVFWFEFPRLTVGADGTVDIQTLSAAVGGSVYVTNLTATRIG